MPDHPHHPGGKVAISLPLYVTGRATFSECGRYRQELWRTWSDHPEYALFIGMNPSTACHLTDDPTCQREWKRAERMGLNFVKTNILDVRLTDSRQLHRLDLPPCSDANLPTIMRLAADASIIVACWGRLHPSLKHHADRVETSLRGAGRTLHCLGRNQDSSPKHPLYLRSDAELIEYLP